MPNNLALYIKTPQIDLGDTLRNVAAIRQAETAQGLADLRLRQANEQRGALAAYAGSGDLNALKMHPEVYGQAVQNLSAVSNMEATREQRNRELNARDAQYVMSLPENERTSAYHERLDAAYGQGRVPGLVYQRMKAMGPSEQVLQSIVDQALPLAQKPSDIVKLGEGEVMGRAVRDPTAAGGMRFVPLATGGQKMPQGYEADPARTGGMRPIAGGPADKITGEQAARVALMAEGLKDIPKLREAFGIRVVSDPSAPNGRRIESMPNARDPAVAPLAPAYDPSGYIQHYAGSGRVGEAQRLMYSAIEGVLRAQTGAAATPEEVKRELAKYLPMPSDSLATRAQKLDLFERNLRAIINLNAHGVSGADLVKMAAQVDKPFSAQLPKTPQERQRLMDDANAAIAKGAPRDAVLKELREKHGIEAQ